jgi:hypothetical protein
MTQQGTFQDHPFIVCLFSPPELKARLLFVRTIIEIGAVVNKLCTTGDHWGIKRDCFLRILTQLMHRRNEASQVGP